MGSDFTSTVLDGSDVGPDSDQSNFNSSISESTKKVDQVANPRLNLD